MSIDNQYETDIEVILSHRYDEKGKISDLATLRYQEILQNLQK